MTFPIRGRSAAEAALAPLTSRWTATRVRRSQTAALVADFYTPPEVVPDTAPGEPLRVLETTVFRTPVHAWRLKADAWRTLYVSTDALGQAIAVSGTVLVPQAEYAGPGPRPVVGFAVGTHGMADRCAPSRRLASGTEQQTVMMNAALARGWAVAVTDYEGLGVGRPHTFMVGRSQGQTVLDAVRAALRIPATGLSPDAPVVIWGYSQGGAAAAWAAEIQPDYAPELRLVGVAAGGVPADLLVVADHLDGGPFFGLLGAAALGHDAAFTELHLTEYLNAAGVRLSASTMRASGWKLMFRYPFRRMQNFTTCDVMSKPEWQERLRASRLGEVAPRVPMYLYHGRRDTVIPVAVGRGLRDRYRGLGVEVEWREHPFGEHLLTALEGIPATTRWLGARLEARNAADQPIG